MKDKKQIAETTDEELVELFNQASSTQEKLQYFSRIKDVNRQMELLGSIPCQLYGRYEYMLLNDEEFNKTHGKYSLERTKTKQTKNVCDPIRVKFVHRFIII